MCADLAPLSPCAGVASPLPGPTLILLNKHILRDLDGVGFNYPMFLSVLGLIS
jgi:hypothetical protein